MYRRNSSLATAHDYHRRAIDDSPDLLLTRSGTPECLARAVLSRVRSPSGRSALGFFLSAPTDFPAEKVCGEALARAAPPMGGGEAPGFSLARIRSGVGRGSCCRLTAPCGLLLLLPTTSTPAPAPPAAEGKCSSPAAGSGVALSSRTGRS